MRLLTAVDLEIDESSLTGETTARRKDAEPCQPVHGPAGSAFVNGMPGAGANGYANMNGMGNGHSHGEPVALADRTCIAYMGTLVRNGEYYAGAIGDQLMKRRQGLWYCHCYRNTDGVRGHFLYDARRM